MKKLKIEELSVESFVVSETSAGERGTVRGHAKSQAQTLCQFTCLVDDCVPTFVFSCGFEGECPK
jgi:hypothetical protein